jgi:hypothetical protein
MMDAIKEKLRRAFADVLDTQMQVVYVNIATQPKVVVKPVDSPRHCAPILLDQPFNSAPTWHTKTPSNAQCFGRIVIDRRKSMPAQYCGVTLLIQRR